MFNVVFQKTEIPKAVKLPDHKMSRKVSQDNLGVEFRIKKEKKRMRSTVRKCYCI